MDAKAIVAGIERAEIESLLRELKQIAEDYGIYRWLDARTPFEKSVAIVTKAFAAHASRVAAERDRLEKALALEQQATAALAERVRGWEAAAGRILAVQDDDEATMGMVCDIASLELRPLLANTEARPQ